MPSLFAAVLLLFTASVPLVTAGDVFAHVVVGNTNSWNDNDGLYWKQQADLAHRAGLSGFVLNIAKAPYDHDSVTNAYKAAAAIDGFSCFLSFDYAAAKGNKTPWTAADVDQALTDYTSLPGQYKYNDKAVVSTFEGSEDAASWADHAKNHAITFLPEWSDKDLTESLNTAGVDGLFSWNAWPNGAVDGPPDNTAYVTATSNAKKTYMHPISPWFFTKAFGKNWLWRGDSLWHTSWLNALKINPPLIEVITWNDWGESQYLAPNDFVVGDIPAEAQPYVTPTDHSAWLPDLKFYINAYKTGKKTADDPHFTFWHRLSPASACGTATMCNDPGHGQTPIAPGDCMTDQIFFTVFPGADADVNNLSVSLKMNGVEQILKPTIDETGAAHGSVEFSKFGGLGEVTVQVTGAGGARTLGPVTGKAITGDCPIQWNVFVAGSGAV